MRWPLRRHPPAKPAPPPPPPPRRPGSGGWMKEVAPPDPARRPPGMPPKPSPGYSMAQVERALEILEVVMRDDPKATIWALPLILQQADQEPWRSIRRQS